MKNKSILYPIIVLLTFISAIYGQEIFERITGFRAQHYLARIFIYYAWWIFPVLIVTGALYGCKNIFRVLGLHGSFIRALGISLIFVFPMFAGSAWLGSYDSRLTFLDVLRKTLLAGFFEELLFRGFLFGILFRWLRWGFIPASLPGAMVFALLHLYQGKALPEITGIFIVTFIGSLWFSWLYTEWDDNLWVAICMHSLMNLSWALFFMDHNALGAWQSNVFRGLTIALSVIFTILYCRHRNKFSITKINLLVNKTPE